MARSASARLFTATLALGAVALLPTAAAAQADVAGRVVDRQSGRGVVGARVEVGGHHRVAMTDSTGRFTLYRVRGGERPVTISALGYEESSATVRVDREGRTELAPLSLVANPVMLEAVRVTADRFESRRRAVPYASRVFSDGQLAVSSAPNLLHYLRDRASVAPVYCRTRWDDGCVMVRGRPQAARVFVDEVPYSLSVLETYPLHDISRVEVYRGGSAIHVYTTWYMERAAKARMVPMPIAI